MFILWFIAFVFIVIGFKWIFSGAGLLIGQLLSKGQEKSLKTFIMITHEIQETIESGLVPTDQRWADLESMSPPWGHLASVTLKELRSNGASLLPTLRRLRQLAEETQKSLESSKSKSSQALAQAGVCIAIVPVFALAMYLLLPVLQNSTMLWIGGSVLAVAFGGCGGVWIFTMADQARWAGIPESQRHWILESQCAVERFLAFMRAGIPADLAWSKSIEFLSQNAPLVANSWGTSIWKSNENESFRISLKKNKNAALELILSSGQDLRRAIHLSVMEGRPCGEKVESMLWSLQMGIRNLVEHELNLLATRALKPLFICVAPALVSMLIFAFYLIWIESGIDGF